MASSPSKVWLITGTSSGLGLSLALAALAAGHTVIGTARDIARAGTAVPQFAGAGGKWLQLDVSSESCTQQIIEGLAQHSQGRIDVLVNNAASLTAGALEDLSVSELQTQLDTNLYGTLRCIHAVLPSMRAQQSGVIVNNGSIFGSLGVAGLGAYSISKFALEGLSETLSLEVGQFGVRVLHLTPGFFRTGIEGRTPLCRNGISPHYMDAAVGRCFAVFLGVGEEPDMVPGDPEAFGQAVLEVVDGTGRGKGLDKFLRMPVGKDGVEYMSRKAESLKESVDAFKELAQSTDYKDFDEEKRLTNYFPKP